MQCCRPWAAQGHTVSHPTFACVPRVTDLLMVTTIKEVPCAISCYDDAFFIGCKRHSLRMRKVGKRLRGTLTRTASQSMKWHFRAYWSYLAGFSYLRAQQMPPQPTAYSKERYVLCKVLTRSGLFGFQSPQDVHKTQVKTLTFGER